MEFRQLITFTSVAQYGGFTVAAKHLHIAQPAVSAQIRALERELGVRLFDRTTRRVRLSRAGEVLLTRALAITEHVTAARADLAELTSVVTGE
ncbi:MAG: LysR family transcriptional regulator, partial [Propionibacteriaceae bacterium]